MLEKLAIHWYALNYSEINVSVLTDLIDMSLISLTIAFFFAETIRSTVLSENSQIGGSSCSKEKKCKRGKELVSRNVVEKDFLPI
jgi:hypothetical protein